MKRRPKIAVVIGSGGIKTLGAVELFEMLEKLEIPIDLLVGCSGGAVLAAAQGAQMPMSEFRDFAKRRLRRNLFYKIDYRTIAEMLCLPFSKFQESQAFLRTDHILQIYYDLYGDLKLEDLKIPTFLQVTDVYTGESLSLSEGSVAKAVYASGAMLPFFPPLYINGRWLADGGFTDGLPIIRAVRQQADIIIALNFTDVETIDQPTDLARYYSNFLKKTHAYCASLQNAVTIQLHSYEVIIIDVKFNTNIEVWEPSHVSYIYKRAREEIQKFEPIILKTIEDFFHFSER